MHELLSLLFDRIMARRADDLLELVAAALPEQGSLLDLGSGTGHFADLVEARRELEVTAADVTDIRRVGPPPVLIEERELPFPDGAFDCTTVLFVLAYPEDPAAFLREAARVGGDRVVLVQSVHGGGLGYLWLQLREFVWSRLGFHVSRALGYVSPRARFTMATRRFYTEARLARDLEAAGLRVRGRRERVEIPGLSLKVVCLSLERHG